MKLTKEECETSLYELKYYSNAYSNAHKSAIKEDVGKLEQLINEYFELIKAIEFIFGVKSEDVLKEYKKMG